MADDTKPLVQRVIVALPFVLTVLGGMVGVAWTNLTPGASPVLGIAGGAAIGRLLAWLVIKVLDREGGV